MEKRRTTLVKEEGMEKEAEALLEALGFETHPPQSGRPTLSGVFLGLGFGEKAIDVTRFEGLFVLLSEKGIEGHVGARTV